MIVNFTRFSPISKFNERIYLGGFCDAQDITTLKSLGINYLINLTHEPMELMDPSVNYRADSHFKGAICIGQEDGEEILDERIEAFLNEMRQGWANPDIVFLIHCHAGWSRTPSFLIAWLMETEGDRNKLGNYYGTREEWDRFEREIRRCRPDIQPHFKLRGSICDFMNRRYKSST